MKMLAQTWGQVNSGDSRHSFLELVGERTPIENVITTGPGISDPEYLYEYQWTLSYPHPKSPHRLGPSDHTTAGATVQMLFPFGTGWRVTEHVATIKHFSPLEVEDALRQKLARDWTEIAPVLASAGKVAADVTGVPQIGRVAQEVARLKATSIPQTDESHWFLKAVHGEIAQTSYQGFEWELSRGLLRSCGTRISGSLLVSFSNVHTWPPIIVSSTKENRPESAEVESIPTIGDGEVSRIGFTVLAKADLKDENIRIPSDKGAGDSFLCLLVIPGSA